LASGASPSGSPSRLSLPKGRICLPFCLERLDEPCHPFALPSLLRHFFSVNRATVLSTRFPSATPFGLALGPDLPRADEPASGILRLSTGQIPTGLLATHTGILTSKRSTSPSGLASSPLERSPTNVSVP